MNAITLVEMLDTVCYDSILKLKLSLIKHKNMGLVFYKENISKLPLDQPFEFYFYATKGTITYQNAFPIPVKYYIPGMSEDYLQYLLPYYQSYYETEQPPDILYFQTLSHFKGEKFVWVYKEGVADVF